MELSSHSRTGDSASERPWTSQESGDGCAGVGRFAMCCRSGLTGASHSMARLGVGTSPMVFKRMARAQLQQAPFYFF